MSYYGEKSRGIPPVPSSLKPTSWEMIDLQDEKKRQADPKLPQHFYTDPSITPYLGLRARLSQLWFNKWTVLLILVLVRVLIMTGGLNTNLEDAKVKALEACTKVEDVGSAMASMPHYLSAGVNSLASDGISKTVRGLFKVLELLLTVISQLIFFVINMYIGTIVCLITAIVRGTLDVGKAAIKTVTDDMNEVIKKITDELRTHLEGLERETNVVLGGIQGLFTPVDVPPIEADSFIERLNNIEINADSALKGLDSLSAKMPTFDDIKNATRSVIEIPFDIVKDAVESKLNFTIEGNIFPLAEKQQLSFCSSNSRLNDFFTSLFEIVAKAKIGFAVAIPILAVLAMIVMGWVEVRRWRRERARAKMFNDMQLDPTDIVYSASRPITSGIGFKVASWFPERSKKSIWARWAVAYGTSTPALFVAALALAGFFSCFCQWLMLRAIEKEAPALANQVGDFAGDVVGTLQQVSTNWANDANGVITDLQDGINKDIFGWVNQTTEGVEKMIRDFDADIDKKVNDIFKDSVLLNTAKEIVNCLIGDKIDNVLKGIDFIQEHAQVSLPLLPNDVFSQGANNSVQGDSEMTSFLASPASVTTDEITGAVQKVINMLTNGIITEALISLGLILVYIIVVLIGIVRALAGMAGPDKTRALGGDQFDSQRHKAPETSNGMGAAPAYEEVVYTGNVPRGKTGLARYPSHARKSSYPEVEDMNR